MESILQFMYLGDARFYHERMREFISVAQDLEVSLFLVPAEMDLDTYIICILVLYYICTRIRMKSILFLSDIYNLLITTLKHHNAADKNSSRFFNSFQYFSYFKDHNHFQNCTKKRKMEILL